MAIQGLGEYGGLYNSYRKNNIPIVDAEYVKEQEEHAVETDANLKNHQNEGSSSEIRDHRSSIADLENVSLTFNSGDTFDYIGSDSDIRYMDVQKAVSDMKKDQILEEYHYFCGNSANHNIKESEDGIVIQKI